MPSVEYAAAGTAANGARSNMVPRFVFVFAVWRVARTESSTLRPTPKLPARDMIGPMTTALATNAAYVVDSSKLSPGCTLPGLRAVASYRQASVAAGPAASGEEFCVGGRMVQ